MTSLENNYCIPGYELKKYLESGPLPETNECSGSGGGTNGVNLT